MTDWSVVQRDESRKVYEAEIAGLKKELAVAKQALENATKARKTKVVPFVAPRKRTGSDVVRVIIPDTHGCLADQKAIAAMLADIKLLDPQEIILLGDHVDCGGFLAQHHVMGYVAETNYTYEEDLAAAATFLDSLRLAAPNARIEYLEGNHERRVETWCVTQVLRHQKDAEGLRRLLAPEFRLRLKDRQPMPAPDLQLPRDREGVEDRLGIDGTTAQRAALGLERRRTGGLVDHQPVE